MSKLIPILIDPISNLVEVATEVVFEESFMRLYENLLDSSMPFLESVLGNLLPDAIDLTEAVQWIVSLLVIAVLVLICKVGRKAARHRSRASKGQDY